MIKRTLLFIPMILCPFGLALAGDWPQWRGPDRTGVSKETGLLESWPPTGPKLLWTFRDAGLGLSCMSVVGDRLYSMGAKGEKEYVYAIDLKTQKKLWSVEIGTPQIDPWVKGPCSTPTIDGNFLYALGSRGNLVCVETASGRKVWSQELVKNLGGTLRGSGYCESPLVDGDLVVVTPGGEKGVIAAFDKKTGTLKWHTTTGEISYSSMIAIEVGGVRQYVQITYGLISVRASDGKLLWKSKSFFEGMSTPIYQNDFIYCVGGYDEAAGCRLFKLMHDGDKFDAKEIYANKEMKNNHWGVILMGKYLYGYSAKGGWICQDFKTGKTVWNKNPDRAMGAGNVTFADGNLYGYHENKGDVLLIKATPDGYKEQGKFRIPEVTKLPRDNGRIWTHPVIANGKLYLRDQELIFCYDVRK